MQNTCTQAGRVPGGRRPSSAQGAMQTKLLCSQAPSDKMSDTVAAHSGLSFQTHTEVFPPRKDD